MKFKVIKKGKIKEKKGEIIELNYGIKCGLVYNKKNTYNRFEIYELLTGQLLSYGYFKDITIQLAKERIENYVNEYGIEGLKRWINNRKGGDI